MSNSFSRRRFDPNRELLLSFPPLLPCQPLRFLMAAGARPRHTQDLAWSASQKRR